MKKNQSLTIKIPKKRLNRRVEKIKKEWLDKLSGL